MRDDGGTAELVVRVQRGDTSAFAPLVRSFLRAAYAVALAIVQRRADAEDVAQDAFVLALEKIQTCRQPERFAGWLLQIVRNRALTRLDERRRRDVPAHDTPITIAVGPAGGNLVGQRLLEALADLTPAQREVVLLHDLEEWTHAEIGDALGFSEGMSRQHLFQARKLLRARLEAERAEAEHE